MSYAEALRLAFGGFRGNKLRTLLTLLGVIIGISSVITILTLGNSLKTQLVESLSETGANDYRVRVQARPDPNQKPAELVSRGGMMFSTYDGDIPESEYLSVDFIDRLRERLDGRVAGISVGNAHEFGDVSRPDTPQDVFPVQLYTVNADYLDMNKRTPELGRMFSADEVAAARPVAVITHESAEEIFGSASEALGKSLEFSSWRGRLTLRVIGVTKQVDTGFLSMDYSEPAAYVPYTVKDRLGGNSDRWSGISIRPIAGVDEDAFRQDLDQFAVSAYAENEDYQAVVEDEKRFFEEFKSQLDMMSVGLSIIAGISLLVGGIGVMNIMLVTVIERTREIGVRKALGAKNADIRRQFVVESMIICLIGGVIGVLLGTVFGAIGASFLGKIVGPPILGVVASLLFSMGIGVFFGFYPAQKAAKLNPIDALRYE